MANPIPDASYITATAKIRNAQLDDLDAMVELLKALFSIEADFAIDEKRQRKGLFLMLDGCQKHRCVKVAEMDGQVVGMCTAQTLISTAEGGPVALIEDMVIQPAFRKKGIGRQLMAEIQSWALTHGITRLQLLADRTNHTAMDFYRHIGWRPTQLICLRRKWNSEKDHED